MREYVIWDIHGCYNELDWLLVKNNINPEKDKIYTVWDLIDKWPDSVWVLELVFNTQYNFLNILWNHDYYFLKYLERILENINLNFNEWKSKIWYLNKKIREIDDWKYKKLLKEIETYNWLLNNIISWYIPYFKSKSFIVVHWWIIPWKKLKKHTVNELIYMNDIDWKFWAKKYRWNKKIFYWHHSKRKKKEIWNTLNLDFWVVKTWCLAWFDLQKNKIITN